MTFREISAALFCLAMLPFGANAADDGAIKYFPAPSRPDGAAPPFSTAVQAGRTLYVSGTIGGGALAKPGSTASDDAAAVLDSVKKNLESAGYTMDDLVWVQIFAADLATYADFNKVYVTYFKSNLPARAFIGAGSLLAGGRYEVMGIAVKK